MVNLPHFLNIGTHRVIAYSSPKENLPDDIAQDIKWQLLKHANVSRKPIEPFQIRCAPKSFGVVLNFDQKYPELIK